MPRDDGATNQGEVPRLSQVIQIGEGKIQKYLREVIRSTMEEAVAVRGDRGRRDA